MRYCGRPTRWSTKKKVPKGVKLTEFVAPILTWFPREKYFTPFGTFKEGKGILALWSMMREAYALILTRMLVMNTLAFNCGFAAWMLNGVLSLFLVSNGVYNWSAVEMGTLIWNSSLNRSSI